MSSELTLIDTNVLVYALFQDSRFHCAATDSLSEADSTDGNFCVVQQVLAELHATITSGKRVTDPYSAKDAIEVAETYIGLPGVELLPQPADLTARTLGLLKQNPVSGPAIFDLQIAAAALGNGVSRILTFDRTNFSRVEEVEVVTP